MYRLLVVDDEEFITDSLAVVLGRLQTVELDVCKAYSGREALEWLNSTRIDIVLTDIRMPGISGLDLMSIIRRRWPLCRIIFLTGFNDFDPVYQAVQAPGVKYLLKTEGYPKVVQAVTDTVCELEEELRNKQLLSQAREQRNLLESLAQEGFIRQLLYGTKAVLAAEIAANFVRLDIPLDPASPVYLVLGNLKRAKASETYTDKQDAAMAVRGLADHFLKDQSRSIGIIDRYGDLFWLVQPQDNTAESPTASAKDMVRFLEGTLELIQSACLDALDAEISFAISGAPCEWECLPDAYERIRQMQYDRTGDGTNMVMTVETELAKSADSAPEPIRREPFDLLAGHLEAGRRDAFLEQLQQMSSAVSGSMYTDTAYVMELYYMIALVLLAYINRRQLHEKISVAGIMRYDAHPSREEAFQHLLRSAETLFAIRREHEVNKAERAMADVCAYIEEHLHEDLSLVQLAKRFHFNPSYLSRLFKQAVGQNISEYIEETRARKAKELLALDTFKIHEIGTRVGYESPHSFSRFFKKRTGMAPQEFRETARTNG